MKSPAVAIAELRHAVLLVSLFVTIIKGEPDSGGVATPKILSRQRRYLVFPEGSSLQLVFDETIPIVDYTLLVTTGETLALAYELPHRPISEDDFLRHALLNEPADALKRKEDTVTPDAGGNRIKDRFYFGNSTSAWQQYWRASPGSGAHRIDSYYKPDTGSDWNRAGWNDAVEPVAMTASKISDPDKPRDIVISSNFPFNRKRPVVALPMGKRSISDESSSKEFFLQHHRDSRYQLYHLIDKYLNSHGHNGMECILKTLCEVGQRPNDAAKGSFVAEMVRAIFRLPDKDDPSSPHHHYHRASRAVTSCSDLFTGCPHSIWSARFMLGL